MIQENVLTRYSHIRVANQAPSMYAEDLFFPQFLSKTSFNVISPNFFQLKNSLTKLCFQHLFFITFQKKILFKITQLY